MSAVLDRRARALPWVFSTSFQTEKKMNMRQARAAHSPEEISAALTAFDLVVLGKIDEEIAEDESFCGLNGFHMRFGCRSAVFHAANVTGMRPRDVYAILGGEEGAFDRASEVFQRVHGVPLIY